MRAVLIEAPGRIGLTTLSDPTPGPRDVVVSVTACGLCGTDLHILQGECGARLPIVPGHEFAGEIVATGTRVTGLAVGDRVAVDPSLYCQECRYCRLGRGNLCDRRGALGVTVPGGAAEYAVAPAANCARLPEHVDTRDAPLIEPLSCAVRGYDVLGSRLGAEALIYGAGTMGLMMLELAKRTGAASVDIVEINPARLATARSLGCTRAVRSAEELDQPRGWDVVIDATGDAAAIQDGLRRIAKAGTFLQFGVSAATTTAIIEPHRVYSHEITITGSMAVLHSYERAACLFAAGVLDPAVFITHRLPLEHYPEAIERFASGEGQKIVVVP